MCFKKASIIEKGTTSLINLVFWSSDGSSHSPSLNEKQYSKKSYWKISLQGL